MENAAGQTLIVDDHVIVAQALSAMLKLYFGLQVTVASSAQEAEALIKRQPFAIALLDLELSEGHGLAIAEILSQEQPSCALIVLSGHVDHFYCPAPLRRRLTAVISKTQYLPELRTVITNVLKSRGIDGSAIDPRSALTAREADVYRLMGQGLSCKAIAADLGLTVRTVESHRKHIAFKLGASGAELVHRATLDHLSLSLQPDMGPGPG